jgi:uncharacterized SAM-binding protein YcdF (DUF218 family)
MDWIGIKAILKALALPPLGPLLLVLFGLAIVARHPRAGRRIAVAGVLILLLLSIPAVAIGHNRFVQYAPSFDVQKAETAQALVVLGSGVSRDSPEYGGDTLSSETLARVRYGARVARMTGLPVLVSGGSVYGGESEAVLMRDALQKEFGIPVRWTEPQSRTTHENAQLSAQLLHADRVARIVLVVHATDMRRAIAEFADAGVQVIPAATGIAPTKLHATDFLPSIAGLAASYRGLYELAALAVRAVSP